MKKKYLFISIVLIIVLITFIMLSFVTNNNNLITVNSNEITSISITERQGQSVIIDDKSEIYNFMNYFESLKIHQPSFHFQKPDNWNYRIAFYGIFKNNLTTLMENFYITLDGNAYKNNFSYKLDDFDYTYFLNFLT